MGLLYTPEEIARALQAGPEAVRLRLRRGEVGPAGGVGLRVALERPLGWGLVDVNPTWRRRWAGPWTRSPRVRCTGACACGAGSRRPWFESRRDPRLFLAGILEAIEKVERYTRGLAREELWNDDLVAGAVMRNPEIVGEAARHVPEGLRAAHPEIDRRRVVGLGNVVGHERFAADLDVVWAVVHGHLPQLKRTARAMLEASP